MDELAVNVIDLKCAAVADDISLCLFSLQIHQAGGQAGFEEGKVSSLVTMWKRSERDSIRPGGTCLCILLKAAHSVCYRNHLVIVHGRPSSIMETGLFEGGPR